MSIIEHKYRYYRDWLLSIPIMERNTLIAGWVFERVMMFSELLREQEREVERFNRNCRIGNYKKSLSHV